MCGVMVYMFLDWVLDWLVEELVVKENMLDVIVGIEFDEEFIEVMDILLDFVC